MGKIANRDGKAAVVFEFLAAEAARYRLEGEMGKMRRVNGAFELLDHDTAARLYDLVAEYLAAKGA